MISIVDTVELLSKYSGISKGYDILKNKDSLVLLHLEKLLLEVCVYSSIIENTKKILRSVREG